MTTPHVRPARPDDLEAVAAFTQDTFTWGDYVGDSFADWLADETGLVIVATLADDIPLAVARVVMLSEREAWMHAARVRPDHRRSGLGSALFQFGAAWAQERGAMVARLIVEDWNEPARGQVEKLGFRRVAEWTAAWRSLGDDDIDPSTNGGRRVPGGERLTPGGAAEVEPAWIAWSSGELSPAGRQLFPTGWHFRRMTIDDVSAAAKRRALWQCPSGWIIGDTEGDTLAVSWLVTTEIDAARLLRAVVDRADGLGVERIRVLCPRVPWLVDALENTFFRLEPNAIYAQVLV